MNAEACAGQAAVRMIATAMTKVKITRSIKALPSNTISLSKSDFIKSSRRMKASQVLLSRCDRTVTGLPPAPTKPLLPCITGNAPLTYITHLHDLQDLPYGAGVVRRPNFCVQLDRARLVRGYPGVLSCANLSSKCRKSIGCGLDHFCLSRSQRSASFILFGTHID